MGKLSATSWELHWQRKHACGSSKPCCVLSHLPMIATSTVLSASRARKWARRCAVQSLANAYGWSSPDDICARGQCSVAPSAPEDGDARSRYFYERGRRVYCLCIWATIKSRYSFQV